MTHPKPLIGVNSFSLPTARIWRIKAFLIITFAYTDNVITSHSYVILVNH